MYQPITRLFSKQTLSMKHSFIREILKMTKGVAGMISFAGGLPSPDSFPKKQLARLFSEVVMEDGEDVLQYGASEGDKALKQAILKIETISALDEEQILITVGSTNGIYFFTRCFIDPGDIVISEAPGFPGSLAAMEACGARFVGVEMDEYGMLPERLKQTLKALFDKKQRVKFIYVIPEFQNPSGKTMNLKRRREIIEIAQQYDVPILEDQPYRELRYDGEKIPTLWELARTEFKDPGRVTICKSFSKILGPGLRLGYTMGPPEVIMPMVMWAQKITVSPDCATQRVAARFIDRGYFAEQISTIINLYRPRRDAMIEALKANMPAGITWTMPEGGMFIWVTMDDKINTDRLLERAIESKVAFIPGSKFYSEGVSKRNELRLNFSYCDVDSIHEGIRRLAQLI
ncbi:MAG: PLP-dependent aminotransferase family protein [Deltaproteobacteria bacterium]|nr:PLP-dependent aminotransferase family protein [Deltaproteobacteria bacterium]